MKSNFITAITESYKMYLTVHPRSSEKLKPIHSFISNSILKKLGTGYSVYSLGIGTGKEFTYTGKYFNKNLDITIVKNGNPVSAIALKFVTTNYKQNGNNYFEGMLGETANIKRNNLPYGQILILRREMPYYSTDKKRFTKIERINDDNLKKYIKLNADEENPLYHKPDLMMVMLIDTGDMEILKEAVASGKPIENIKMFRNNELLPRVKVTKLEKEDLKDLSAETLAYLDTHSSLEKFIDAFVHLTHAYEYGK